MYNEKYLNMELLKFVGDRSFYLNDYPGDIVTTGNQDSIFASCV